MKFRDKRLEDNGLQEKNDEEGLGSFFVIIKVKFILKGRVLWIFYF